MPASIGCSTNLSYARWTVAAPSPSKPGSATSAVRTAVSAAAQACAHRTYGRRHCPTDELCLACANPNGVGRYHAGRRTCRSPIRLTANHLQLVTFAISWGGRAIGLANTLLCVFASWTDATGSHNAASLASDRWRDEPRTLLRSTTPGVVGHLHRLLSDRTHACRALHAAASARPRFLWLAAAPSSRGSATNCHRPSPLLALFDKGTSCPWRYRPRN